MAEGAAPLEFKDRESLEVWLRDQTRDVAVIIAARATLRVLPLAASGIAEDTSERFAELIAALFRATALARVTAKYPDLSSNLHLMGKAAEKHAFAKVGQGSGSAGFVAFAATHCIRAATTPVAHIAEAAIDAISDTRSALLAAAANAASTAAYTGDYPSAAATASSAVSSANATADIWTAITADANFLRAPGNNAALLAVSTLWPERNVRRADRDRFGLSVALEPHWALASRRDLVAALPKHQNWDVWTDWYEARLKGRADPEEIELVYATVPKEKWDEGPAAANAWIKEQLQRLEGSQATEAKDSTKRLEFKDRETLEAWLRKQPREVAVIIAARAALRVLPIYSRAFGHSESPGRFATGALALWRAVALARAAGKYPSRTIHGGVIAVASAASAAGTVGGNASAVAAACAAAISAAATPESDPTIRGGYAAYASAAASAASEAPGTYVDRQVIWIEIAADALSISGAADSAKLADSSIWLDGAGPSWAAAEWNGLLKALSPNEDWDVWFDWYEGRIEGRCDPEEIELVYATVPPEKWDEGPAAANAWIKAELARLHKEQTPSWATTLSTATPPTLSVHWVRHDSYLVIDPAGSESDIAVTRDPITRQLHSVLRQKAQEFCTVCAGVDELHGWEGLESAARRFNEEVSRDIDQIPGFIGLLYPAIVSLGSFLEQDNRVRADKRINDPPLPLTLRRAFEELIRLSAPWVRRFPTARVLDDEAGAFLARPEFLMPAAQIIIDAREQSLISDRDRDLILALIAAVERDGFIGHKGGAHGVQSVKGLTITALAFVATFYSGALASGYANESPLIKKVGKFLAANEARVTSLLSHEQPDMRLAVQSALEALKHKPLHDAPDHAQAIKPKLLDEEEDDGGAP